MLGRLTAAFLMLALLGSGLVAQPGTKDKADKADLPGIVGKVVAVDQAKGTVTINVDGKNQTFTVDKETAIVGPLGGKSDGLKDDRLAKGLEITVYPAKDPKVAGKIKLDYRPRETKDAPTKDAPAKDTPAKDAPVKDAPAKDKTTPTKDKTTPPKDKDKKVTPPAKDKK